MVSDRKPASAIWGSGINCNHVSEERTSDLSFLHYTLSGWLCKKYDNRYSGTQALSARKARANPDLSPHWNAIRRSMQVCNRFRMIQMRQLAVGVRPVSSSNGSTASLWSVRFQQSKTEDYCKCKRPHKNNQNNLKHFYDIKTSEAFGQFLKCLVSQMLCAQVRTTARLGSTQLIIETATHMLRSVFGKTPEAKILQQLGAAFNEQLGPAWLLLFNKICRRLKT